MLTQCVFRVCQSFNKEATYLLTAQGARLPETTRSAHSVRLYLSCSPIRRSISEASEWFLCISGWITAALSAAVRLFSQTDRMRMRFYSQCTSTAHHSTSKAWPKPHRWCACPASLLSIHWLRFVIILAFGPPGLKVPLSHLGGRFKRASPSRARNFIWGLNMGGGKQVAEGHERR